MQFIFGLLWVIAGLVISIPYTFLSGGNYKNFMFTVFFGPVAGFILFVSLSISRVSGSKLFFWLLILYFCFPIILNGISILLRWSGENEIGSFVFTYRYFSLFAIPVAILASLLIWNLISEGWKKLTHKTIPPSDSDAGNSMKKTT